MGCSSCHIGGTSRLTAFGRDFQIRGHRTKFEEKFLNWSTLADYVTVSAKLRYNGTAAADQSPLNMQDSSLFTGGALTRSLSYYAEYSLFARNTAPASTRFADAYLQYTGGAGADRYWYARTGRLYPFAIYAADAGGRPTVSRPRLIGDKLAGFIPSLQARVFGVSGGYADGRGGRVEAAVTGDSGGSSGGDASSLVRRPGAFLTLEKDFDAWGSGVSAYQESGYVTEGGARFRQSGLLGRFVRERFTITGGIGVAAARDEETGRTERPTAYYLEGTRNFLADTTGFVRYDNLQNHAAGTPRTQGYALGVTQRLPQRGKVALEYAQDFAGVKQNHSLLVDVLLMY
jgi:hypothetical protein